MAESLARYSDGLPNELHETLYSQWAEAGYGLLITGEPASEGAGADYDIP